MEKVRKIKKITYSKYLWKEHNYLDFNIQNFYCEEEVCPFSLETLAQYRHYNVVLDKKNSIFGPDVTIYKFTINDFPCVWIWDVITGENTIRAIFAETPENMENKTLEKIVQDLCDVLNTLIEKGEITSTDDK